MNFRDERTNLIDVLLTLRSFQSASRHPEILEKGYKQMKKDTVRVYNMVQKDHHERPKSHNPVNS